MQLRLPFGPGNPAIGDPAPRARQRVEKGPGTLLVGHKTLTVFYVRHRRARHYVLRVRDDGTVRVTVPRGGSRAEADRFVREKAEWIERERYHAALRAARQTGDGTSVMLRGVECAIEIEEGPGGRVARAGELAAPLAADMTPLAALERQLRCLAGGELPRRLMELAEANGCRVAAVTIRGQRTRWGSCSPTGRISLNWRLIQLPPSVRDYVLLHELAHLRRLDHSRRFWRELEKMCPWHREARAWLKVNARRLRAS